MKKTFKLENLDCANCAARMERSVAAIKGVNSVVISFMTSRMKIDFEDESVMDEVKKAIKNPSYGFSSSINLKIFASIGYEVRTPFYI